MKACSICNHAERAEIDRALIESVPLRTIEARHHGTTRSALDRHRKHIPAALTQARRAIEASAADSLLSRVEKLLSRSERLLDQAEAAQEWTGAVAAAREIRSSLELLGKLRGELQTPGARLAVSLTQIHSIDISALSKEQVGLIYDRIERESIREIDRMSNEELEAELAQLFGFESADRSGSINLPGNRVPHIPQTIEGTRAQ